MIGLAPSHKNQLCNYTSWLEKRGFSYKILSSKDDLSKCSMLILCGGPDVGKSKERDENEIRWMKEAYGKIPVLGICRGLQISNVILGGTLHEDLSEELVKHTSNKVSIAGEPEPLLESSWHDVILNDGRTIKVNSRHHQGIDKIAPGLKVLGVCDKDNLPEILEGENSLFVQWHPERPDVWGTEAESVVYEWMRTNYKGDSKISPIEQIFEYMRRKNFTVVSNERIRKSVNSSFTDSYINNLIVENSSLIKRVKDKNGRLAVKKLTS